LFDFDLKPGLFVTLEVADTGCGMDKQTLAQMFDPFFTTKFTGRGLGLSAVMGIVRSHEGALRVYSEVGKGTAFKLMLPASKGTAATTDQTAQADYDPHWQGHGAVLLVEDEEAIRALAGYILERLGFKVYTAADGVEALELHAAHRDELVLVLLDLTMPRKSGEETLHDLRTAHPELPVIIASGYSKDEIAARLAAKGVAAFVQKPYSMSSLGSTLRRVLESKPKD
jgi:two-component system, cell cycle sensor histidine kinase and response regulator CckA